MVKIVSLINTVLSYVCTRSTNYPKKASEGTVAYLVLGTFTPHRLHVHSVPKTQKRNWKGRLLPVFPLMPDVFYECAMYLCCTSLATNSSQ